MEPEELKQILADYVATANNPKYNKDFKIINSKFPELKDYDSQLLADYVATANNKEYGGDFEVINSKFPEFFEVKKKDQPQQLPQPSQEQPIASVGGYEVPSYQDTIYAGELPEVKIEEAAPTLEWWKSIENTKDNFAENLKSILPKVGLFTTQSFEKILGKEASNWLYGLPTVDINLETGEIKLVDGRTIDEARNQAIDELTAIQSKIKPTLGIIDSAQNFDIPGLAAGIVNVTSDLVTTALPAAVSFGASIPMQMIGQSFYDYNEAKAKSKGMTINELLDKGQGDYSVPLATGTLASAMEYVGLKGLSSAINRKLAGYSGQRMAALMFSDYNKEGLTELSQLGIDVYNRALGSGMSNKDAAIAAADAMFSKQGLEAYAGGLIGSATVGTATRLAKTALSPLKRKQVDNLENEKDNLYKDLTNQNIPEEAKVDIAEELLNVNDKIDDIVNDDAAVSRNMTEESRSRIEELQDNITKIDESMVDEGVSDISKKALRRKKKEFTKELDSLLKEGEQNAIQEQTAGEVPIQPEAEISGEVAQGKPQAKPEGVTESKKEINKIAFERAPGEQNKGRNWDLRNQLLKSGLLMHGSKSSISKFDPSLKSRGVRATYGNGLYFTEDQYKASNYGDKFTYIDKSKLNIIDADKDKASDIIPSLSQYVSSLPEGGLKSKYESLLSGLDRFKDQNVDEARKNVLESIPEDMSDEFSDLLRDSGYDGVKVGYEYSIFNIDKANRAIVKNPSKFLKITEKATPVSEPVSPTEETTEVAEDIELEEKPQRQKTSPIKSRIEFDTGVKKKPVNVVVDEVKALRSQILLESKAAKKAFAEGKRTVKEQVAAQNQILKAGRDAIGGLIKSAKSTVFKGAQVKGSLAYRMLNRVNAAKTPLQLERALDYVQRSISDIDYNNKLNTSEKLSKAIQSKSGNLPINLQEAFSGLAKSRPRRSEDLADFNNLVSSALGAIQSKGQFAINQAEIDRLTERIKKNNLTDKIETLSAMYPELGGYISDSIKDMQNVVDSYDKINVDEVSEGAISRAEEKREALESLTQILQDDISEYDTEGLTDLQKEMVEAMSNIDYTELSDKQLTFLNNAINNLTENGSFDGVGQYILNEYRIQKTLNPAFVDKLKGSVVKLNGIAKALAKFRTLPTNLKAIMKTSMDAAMLRTAVGFGQHERAYTAFLNKMDNTMNQISDLSKKLGIYDSYESAIKIGVFSDLLQHKEGLSDADIQKEYEGRVSALARGLVNAETIMSKSLDYAENNGDKINAVRDIFDKYVSKAETPEQLREMLTDNEAKFRDAVLAKFEEIKPDLQNISKVYKNKSFDNIVGYFPRIYVYPPTKISSDELSNASQRILEMSTGTGRQNMDTDVSTAFDERLLERGGLPKDAIVDYDFLGVFQNEYRKQLYDAKTMDSRSLLAQSLSSKKLEEALKGDLDIKRFVENSFDQRVKNEKSGLYSSNKEKLSRVALSAFGNIGNKIALGGILTPWFKQTIPGLASAMVNTSGLRSGKAELNPVVDAVVTISENPAAFKKFIESSPVSRRHKQQAQFISESIVSTEDFRKVKDYWARKIKGWDKFSEDVFMKSLKLGDMTGAGISYLAYYKYYLLKNGLLAKDADFNMQEHALNPNKEALDYAEQMTSQTLNISASVDKARLQVLGGILPFISFAVNSISNASINLRRLTSVNGGLSLSDRADAAKQLAARVVESVTINAISGGFRTLFITVGATGLSELVKSMVADDDEQKEILDLIQKYADEYIVKTWENVGSYITSDILTGQIAENIIGPIVDTGITSYEELSAAITGEDYSQQQKPVRPGEAFKILGKYGIVLSKAEELRQNLTSFIESQNGYFLPRKYGYIDINDKVSIKMSKSKEKAPDWAKYAYLYATTSNLLSLLGGGSFAEAAAISRRLPGVVKRTIVDVYGKDNNFHNKIKKDDSLPYSYSKLEDEHATINYAKVEYYLNPDQLKEWSNFRREFFKKNYNNSFKLGLQVEKSLNPLLRKEDRLDAFDFVEERLVKAANTYAERRMIFKYKKGDKLMLNTKEDVKKKLKK